MKLFLIHSYCLNDLTTQNPSSVGNQMMLPIVPRCRWDMAWTMAQRIISISFSLIEEFELL